MAQWGICCAFSVYIIKLPLSTGLDLIARLAGLGAPQTSGKIGGSRVMETAYFAACVMTCPACRVAEAE